MDEGWHTLESLITHLSSLIPHLVRSAIHWTHSLALGARLSARRFCHGPPIMLTQGLLPYRTLDVRLHTRTDLEPIPPD